MSNIRDVAKQAGVSTATVSRYFSNPAKLSPKSAEKVRNAIESLNYTPNLLARNFNKSRSYSVLVLVPDIANPFFSRIIRGMEDAGQQKGYSVLLGNTRYSEERERAYINLVSTRQADGIIQLSYNVPRDLDSLLGRFVQACECIESNKYPTVKVDNIAAAQKATEHFIDMGHRRIACILGPETSPLTHDRLKGYELALANANIEFDPDLIVAGDFSMNSGFHAASKLLQLEESPSATFCMNDEMAIGLIRGITNAGLLVPQDMSVIGFDDIEFAKYCEPPLTTISQPMEDLGRTAMNYLCDLLTNETRDNNHSVLPTQFIVRESTARYRPK